MTKPRATPASTPTASLDEFMDRGRQLACQGGRGVPIKNYRPFSDFVLSKMVKKAELINAQALLPTDGEPVVVIASHGPNIAWVPLAALVGKFFYDSGYGDIVGGFFPHKAVFLVPGFKDYYKRVLGAPTDIHTVEAIVDLLKNHEVGVTGTAPEGANCLLAYDEYVAPFQSVGMIAAAIRANASICLVAHQGAEDWNLRLRLPFGWKVPLTNGLRGINIPLIPFKKIDRYMARCERFKPRLRAKDLEGKSKRQVRLMLSVEVERIRAAMNLMTDELKERIRIDKAAAAHRPDYALVEH
ncbi:MAG: hypothetical protein IPH37_14840 [Burkholderiales bacterium]|nr:hypothetical protein [Burkholderiales bacterium]